MNNIGLFFGSETGNTESVADEIAGIIGYDKVDVYNLSDHGIDICTKYDKLIFGAPTWYDGELQSDWDSAVDDLEKVDLTGKTIALFGLGDQEGYPDYFLDAMGIIYEKVIEKGGNVVGEWPVDGYTFDESKAVKNGNFVGLALDEDNQSDLTNERIEKWLVQIHIANLQLNDVA